MSVGYKQVPNQHGTTQSSGKAIASLVLGLLSFFCIFFTGIPAIILGILGLRDIGKHQGRMGGNGLAIAGIVLGMLGCIWSLLAVAVMLPAVQQVRSAARRTTSMNQLREMSLGMMNFESANRHLPIAEPDENTTSGSKLSWRVQILPYIEENELYNSFHHDEPWNSPHNMTLIDRMPDIFKTLGHELASGKTMFVVPTTIVDEKNLAVKDRDGYGETIFVKGQPTRFAGITDGTSNTILIMQVPPESAVTWTQPTDWQFDPASPKRGIGNVYPGITLVVFADGSTHAIPESISAEDFKKLLSKNDGHPVSIY